jgi:hypothetical protein
VGRANSDKQDSPTKFPNFCRKIFSSETQQV